jgi:hypothetical protein
MKPLLYICETIEIGDVVNNNDAMSPAIVTGSNSPETLLSSGIPLRNLSTREKERSSHNLEFNCFRIQINCSDFLKKCDEKRHEEKSNSQNQHQLSRYSFL